MYNDERQPLRGALGAGRGCCPGCGAFGAGGEQTSRGGLPGNNGLIAFASTRSTASGDPSSSDFEIFTAPLIGDLTQLTVNSTNDGDPAFSADGAKIAFTSSRDGNPEVYVMNADGSGQTNLTNNAANDSEPAFSPDGKRIAFTSFRNGNIDVYVIDSDGTDLNTSHQEP